MNRLVTLCLLSLPVLLTGCQSAPGSGPAPAPAPQAPAAAAAPATAADEPSTLDGVYTEAQAGRGLQVYESICSECHSTDDWVDDGFKARWNDESVYRFWYYIYESMPEGEPPYTLAREDVTDVLTYILQLNGLPSGPAELGSDDDSIDQYWLRWGAPQP